ncbi:MAG: phage tail sheath C-terminal domain-containing protein [Chitinophagaceae bacterium]
MAITTLATPGVYIDERSVFPNSVVSIPTAVPAFVGYTEKAEREGKLLVNRATRISSLAEYINLFGGPPVPKFDIADVAAAGAGAGAAAPANPPAEGATPAPPAKPAAPDFTIAKAGYTVTITSSTSFLLFNALRLFYANGGGDCYIVSVGTYGNNASITVDKPALEAGIAELVKHSEPTILVVPEAILLTEDNCAALQQTMLVHCGDVMKNRVAILDVYNGYKARDYDDQSDVITKFRGTVTNFLDFGAAYYPWLETSIVQTSELDFRNFSDANKLADMLGKEATAAGLPDAQLTKVKAEIDKVKATTNDKDAKTLNQLLMTVSPGFKTMINAIRKKLNLMAPSAAMAGIYSLVDNNRAVWKAPANVGVSSVVAPAVDISDKDQEDLNVTLSGKSVNAIRSFIGEGVKCWGARTLDGNSNDWRYINVRRTLIFLEQSIKAAAKAYVFEPNDPNTWVSVKSMISNFLNDIWKQGGLVGTKPDDAFVVEIGQGITMTALDVLEGKMRITVKVAVSHPAEFIIITFEQQMQKA